MLKTQVWYGGLVQIGFIQTFDLLHFVDTGGCTEAIYIDGGHYKQHPNFEEIDETFDFSYNNETDYLLPGIATNVSELPCFAI